MSTLIVIGGQYGSEGKGAFVAHLTDPRFQGNKNPFLVVRTGGPNAGHSMKYNDEVFKMRHIPCAWHNPNAVLALGPGAVIDPEYLLEEEIPQVEAAGISIRDRFFIDPMCAIITDEDRQEGKKRIATIGGTGKGVGGATARRVLREGPIARDWPSLQPFLRDVSELSNTFSSATILIESTQGFGLSLTRSGFYPYTTNRDITPGAVMNESGVSFCGEEDVVLVLRTFPIRVAGPSGPMVDEISWEELERQSDGYIKPERTTVTNKIRRVGLWDPDLARQAVIACSPAAIALTFFDYWRPDLAYQTKLDADAYRRIEMVEKQLGVSVVWVSTGFQCITRVKGGRRA
ncbi:hypothetical protein LCGC14_0846730 [marine sediment metagenome]|uniref:Adenylosuccinate synthetase n=1 Tax=marine sediment metagenome TaxID=412755 RepID=A0A0F9PWR2_9ZZZZ